MSSAHLTDAEVRALGWQALIEKLGPSGALRFSIQTERGYGDYAAVRHELLGRLSVDELIDRVRRERRPRRGPPGSRGRRGRPGR